MTIVIAFLLYVGVAAIISAGIHKRYARRSDYPSVSIVIPARNEETTIGELLESLQAVEYPPDQLEVLIIDDQSTDNTVNVAESFRGRFPFKYEVYRAQPEVNSNLRAKTRPLAQGLDRALGEIVLMPDADNRIPPRWVKCMTSYFADGVGMVCGTTLPDAERRQQPWLTSLEIIDSALLLGSCAGFSGLGRTQALIGSNFAIRRSAYQEIGTYRSLDFHVIEDLSLLQALQSKSQWRAIFPADEDTLLLTLPQRTFADLIRQRHRWMEGWQHVRPAIRTALTAGIVAHVAVPFLLLLPWHYALISYLLLAVGDGIVAGRMLAAYRMGSPALLLLYPVFTTLYAIPLILRILTRQKIEWKERTL